jgi:serine/threonine protein kinase
VSATVGPGTTFAGYRVEALVGRGGMGVVYRARDAKLERAVALKLIAPELARDERFHHRFLNEPRLAAALDHPHVIPIYDAGECDGQLFLVMRYVDGTDLATLLRRDGPLEPERVVRLLGQIADALDVAHRRGLVHRDVKPANVLVDGDDHAYLTDFGVSKLVVAGSTDTGAMIGTLEYMAPSRSAARPSTVAATSTHWAACCTSCSPVRRRSVAKPRRRRCGRTSRPSHRRSRTDRRWTRSSARRSPRSARRAIRHAASSSAPPARRSSPPRRRHGTRTRSSVTAVPCSPRASSSPPSSPSRRCSP